MLEKDLIYCVSKMCPYKSSCLRHSDEEPPSDNQEYFNYEYTCDYLSGFPYYILKIRKGVDDKEK